MSKLEVFEAAMCCPSGVCGVSVDPVLAQFNADLQALERSGVAVARHNLGQDAAAFAAHAGVLEQINAGMDRLPVVTVDGRIVSTGVYPSKAQLMGKLGLADAQAAKARAGAGGCGCGPGGCR
jgi:hypothetical protein